MKLLTKEEEDAHYRSVVKGGTLGGLVGLAGGAAGVLLAARRYHTIRNLTVPMKAFLMTSSGTFVGIVAADHASRNFEMERNADRVWYENREERLRSEEMRGLSFSDRAVAFARREKYKIVGATWVASMIGSFVLVGRNPYLTGQQKIVQARVYAQGLTLGVLCASAAFEISDQRRGRGILDAAKKEKGAAAPAAKQASEPTESTPSHQGGQPHEGDLWKDMVASEEQRLKKKHQSLYEKHHEEAQSDAPENTQKQSSESSSDDAQESQPEPEKKSESEKKPEPENKKQA
ncbi:hypothetical protein NUU61_006543 [Penicillium alfredii]|uniref:HIG1 domain-containing protein n=1 Tax=Penicillium alfredii TaxID=1506179 RepID=A0A9W9F113_9EURO|nr:uncharacterized protein NUU61_006543 [Penicillium alfredii]KAJ5091673.1 hypothetical protein NUU61_006543 [Penicillium alfredii]